MQLNGVSFISPELGFKFRLQLKTIRWGMMTAIISTAIMKAGYFCEDNHDLMRARFCCSLGKVLGIFLEYGMLKTTMPTV